MLFGEVVVVVFSVVVGAGALVVVVLLEVVVGANVGADADSVGGVSVFVSGVVSCVVAVDVVCESALADATIASQFMSMVSGIGFANRSW